MAVEVSSGPEAACQLQTAGSLRPPAVATAPKQQASQRQVVLWRLGMQTRIHGHEYARTGARPHHATVLDAHTTCCWIQHVSWTLRTWPCECFVIVCAIAASIASMAAAPPTPAQVFVECSCLQVVSVG